MIQQQFSSYASYELQPCGFTESWKRLPLEHPAAPFPI
jgi:hypothetical protein